MQVEAARLPKGARRFSSAWLSTVDSILSQQTNAKSL
jgi:hypothetical protein